MKTKISLFILLLWTSCLFSIENKSIIQITLAKSNQGLLQGSYPSKVSIIDYNSGETYWKENQNIIFADGFAEIELGPVDSFNNIKVPYVILEVDHSVLSFPIYPSLFSLHSKTTDQLSDTNAIFVNNSKTGFGTKDSVKMTEKLNINGNIKFLNDENKIIFQNGQSLSSQDLLTMKGNISQIMTSLTILQGSSISSSDIQINTISTSSVVEIFNETFSTNPSLKFEQNIFKINDNALGNDSLVFWKNQQFQSVQLSSLSDIVISGNSLAINSNFKITDSLKTVDSIIKTNQNMIGIGVMPTNPLDVNGSIRLRDHASETLTNPANGTIIFDGNNFKGYVNNEWKTLSGTPTIYTTNNTYSNTFLNLINDNLIVTINNNVGIKTESPTATLDISGTIRIRNIPSNQSLNSFIVQSSNGDLFSRTLSMSDLISSENNQDILKFNNGKFAITTTNVIEGDILYFTNNEWTTTQNSIVSTFQGSNSIEINNRTISIAHQNASLGDQLTWNGNTWIPSANTASNLSYEGSNPIEVNGNTISLSSQNTTLGDQLIWNGNHWVPSSNLRLVGTNGININNKTISLEPSISLNYLNVNQVYSTQSSPFHIVDASNSQLKLVDINSLGQLSLGFNGAHESYTFASNGLNYLAHLITRYQSAIGTVNIGTVENGPTLLIQQASPISEGNLTRSILEVLTIDGNSAFEIQDGGNVGINTGTPKTTLDINGLVKLKKYSSAPDINGSDSISTTPCGLDYDGTIALTSKYTLCTCKGSSGIWVETSDGTSPCSWQ